tara:strand:+ start:86 stop:220 length:135 start_codon:yes stop_codon:yes gene_type:complete
MNFNGLLIKAINASIKGGHAIMDLYASDFAVEHVIRQTKVDCLV